MIEEIGWQTYLRFRPSASGHLCRDQNQELHLLPVETLSYPNGVLLCMHVKPHRTLFRPAVRDPLSQGCVLIVVFSNTWLQPYDSRCEANIPVVDQEPVY